MGDPRTSVDAPGLDEADDVSKVGRQGIAGAEERAFGAVKIGMPKADFFAGETDEDKATTVRNQAERGGHRLGIARGVDDDVGEVAGKNFAELGLEIVLPRLRVGLVWQAGSLPHG